MHFFKTHDITIRKASWTQMNSKRLVSDPFQPRLEVFFLLFVFQACLFFFGSAQNCQECLYQKIDHQCLRFARFIQHIPYGQESLFHNQVILNSYDAQVLYRPLSHILVGYLHRLLYYQFQYYLWPRNFSSTYFATLLLL